MNAFEFHLVMANNAVLQALRCLECGDLIGAITWRRTARKNIAFAEEAIAHRPRPTKGAR